MSNPPCVDLAPLRSAFVDGALGPADRDRLLNHLAGCPSCRQDVADLRAVRQLVGGSYGTGGPAPADLAARLLAIAQASGPATRGRRRPAWSRTTFSGAAAGAVVLMVGFIGWAAAPAGPVPIADPAAEAQAEFTSAVGHTPLGPDALTAAMVADPITVTTASRGSGSGPIGPTTIQRAGGVRLSAAEAVTTLRRAAAATGTTSYVGEQTYFGYGSGRTLVARVRVVAEAGQGSQISVLGNTGSPVLSGFKPAAVSSRMADTEVWSLLERNYELAGWRGAVVAGRHATMIEAVRGSSPASRWWVDDRTGVVLWQDSFGPGGRPVASAGFTAIRMQSPAALMTHLPAKLTVPVTSTTLTVSDVDRLTRIGWFGQRELSGMSLVRLRTDRASDPDAVHLTYSDGLNVVTVLQRRGCLGEPPAASAWDPAVHAYVRTGTSRLATWQSAGTVLTVMTNGSSQLLADAVAGLPHEPVAERTSMDRIQAGWAEILADLRG